MICLVCIGLDNFFMRKFNNVIKWYGQNTL